MLSSTTGLKPGVNETTFEAKPCVSMLWHRDDSRLDVRRLDELSMDQLCTKPSTPVTAQQDIRIYWRSFQLLVNVIEHSDRIRAFTFVVLIT